MRAKLDIGGYFYICNSISNKTTPLTNGPSLCHLAVINRVVSSVVEAEFVSAFVNAEEGTVTRTTLSEIGHPQEETDLNNNNPTVYSIDIKKSKRNTIEPSTCGSIGSNTKQFDASSWAPADIQMGDYFTNITPWRTTSECAHSTYMIIGFQW
jgi:hypothetical protein